MSIRYSVVDSANLGNAYPISQPIDFPSFCDAYRKEIVGTPHTTPKPQLTAICVGVYADSKRRNANFQGATLLHADIDHDFTSALYAQLLQDLESKNYAYLLVESPSSTPDAPRVRLYFPLYKEVLDVETYKRGYLKTLNAHFPYITFDSQCIDPARFMYIPSETQLATFRASPDGSPIEFIEEEYTERQRKAIPETPSYQDEEYKLNNLDIALRDWGLNTFDLTLGGHAPHSPFRLDSDSGNYKVHWYGIYDFQAKETIRWSKLHEEIQKDDTSHIHQYYTHLFEKKDKPVLNLRQFGAAPGDKNIVPCFVEAPGTGGRYYITLDKDPEMRGERKLYPLDTTRNEFKVCLSAIESGWVESYWPREILGFQDKENGRFNFFADSDLKAKYRATPESTIMFLGADTKGNYYCPESRLVYEANHAIKQVEPKYHENIHKFLEQLDIDYDWICRYLYFSTDCTKALPWLHMFGVAKSGKTFLAQLIGTLFTSQPLLNPITGGDFQTGWGDSPVMLMDEQIPANRFSNKSTINKIKELVTSYVNEVNRKYMTEAKVEGYHRVLSTQNAGSPELPLADQEDLGALMRRMMPIYFGEDQVKFLEGIPLKETEGWLNGQFAEHVAYIRKSLGEIEAEGSIAVTPLENKYINKKTLNISPEHRNFLTGLIEYCSIVSNETTISNQEEVGISTSKLVKYLHTNSYTKGLWDGSEATKLIRHAMPNTERKRVREGGGSAIRMQLIRREELEKLEARLYGEEV